MAGRMTVYHVSPSGDRAAAAGVNEPHRTQKDAIGAARRRQGTRARADHRARPRRSHSHRLHLRRGLARRASPQGRGARRPLLKPPGDEPQPVRAVAPQTWTMVKRCSVGL